MKPVSWVQAAGIGLATLLFLSLFFSAGVFSNVELTLENGLYGGSRALDGIVIVAIDDSSLQAVGRWPWDRNVTARLVSRLSQAKAVGVDIAFFEPSSNASDEALAQAIAANGNAVIPVEYSESGVLTPASGIGSKATLAYINVITDPDGVTRAIPLIEGKYPAFSQALYSRYWEKNSSLPAGRYLINFVGAPGSFTTISAKDVLSGVVPPERFSGKLVLLGSTAPDLHDDHIVPTGGGKRMPGVEVHANAVQTMILHRQVTRMGLAPTAFLMLVAIIMATVLFLRVRLSLATAALFLLSILYYFAAIHYFNATNSIANLVYPVLAAFASFGAIVGFAYFFESRSRRFIADAFGKYVSKDVMNAMMADPGRLRLGGEKTAATIFFSDVRGFTTISEKLTPEQLVHLLNEYLTAMTDIVMDNRGLVDKYIGDAIMAIWGAPVHFPDHAASACEASLRMLEALDPLRQKWSSQGYPDVNIGIGLNTGEVVVGNMGSQSRFNYTAMGDSVNLASRLEGLNKEYRTRIIASEFTKASVGGAFIFKELDLVAVKGKKQPVRIYELVCRAKDADEATKRRITVFETALSHYRKQEWKQAAEGFAHAKQLGDATADVFLARIEHLAHANLPSDWDGVNVMKTK